MRLPQDRILHIGTELARDKVRIIAEWQGELVRCKDCKHYISDGGSLMVCSITEMITNDNDYCSYGERRENDV